MKKWLKFILLPAGFLIFIVALALLNDQLKSISYADIKNAMSDISGLKIAAAMFFALLYYALLGGYDILAYKYIDPKTPLKPKDIAFVCFISNVFGNNTGYSMLFGGSLRYRLYSIHNVSMLVVTKVLFFSSATIWLGLLTIGGIVFTFSPVSLYDVTGYDISTSIVGIIFLLVLFLYVFFSFLNLKSLKIFNKTISLPNIKIAAWQIFLASADWLIASFTLWILMPQGEIPYFVLLKVFLVAQLLGILSQVPGGMGVFEASIAVLLPQALDNPATIGALLVYRAVFYFFPLSVALTMLASYEIARLIKKVDEKTKMIGRAVSHIMVQALSAMIFFAGILGLYSAFSPFEAAAGFLPKWFLDGARLLLSAISAALLFISRAAQLRIKTARFWTCLLLAASIVLFFAIGANIVFVISFALLLMVFFNSSHYFYRTKSLFAVSFGLWQICAIAVVLVLTLWMGFFINKYQLLIWRDIFMDFGNSMAVLAVFLAALISRFFNVRKNSAVKYQREDIVRIAKSAHYAYSFAALSLDKKLLLSDKKDALIMFADTGINRIALGDPIGGNFQKGELIWRFKEIADMENKKIAFIGADAKLLSYYKDIGLDIFPIGAKAKIDLNAFKADDYFADIARAAKEEGIVYEIVSAVDFENYRAAFLAIDEAWKKDSDYMSRNFVLGNYEPDILSAIDYGVLKKDGRIFAFAPFLWTKNKNEFSTPIVRYLPFGKAHFVYFVYENVLHAKCGGFRWFDLGLAYENQDGNADDIVKYFAKVFAFCEHFNDDLNSLLEFKRSFQPVWRDKFMALSSEAKIKPFIKNFTALISPPDERSKLKFFRKLFARK
jgi:phosphatidylglycerol lysyltransferase